ncbi:class I SAM-dependent methyltransferase [Corallococcus silvisoli]|uniref:class I SAM-dependent methyltransferase n=1 Tax=Corallococcus silvisoli TaxID=2697031 RepID=UPI0013787221|nr:class I SAM-dependent methyltransferase [Corallococcus silvisoli]NBD12950.1 hypothetical protein [Corallococcus silvisoli]
MILSVKDAIAHLQARKIMDGTDGTRLKLLARACEEVERMGVPGLFIEAGVANDILPPQGDAMDTLAPGEAVAVAHMGCEGRGPVQACVEQLAQRISPNGMIVFAHYRSSDDRRRLLDEWVVASPEFRVLEANESLIVQRRTRDASLDHATRWANPVNVQGHWTERARRAAVLVTPGASVLDIGAGEMAVRWFLAPPCRYTPSDFVKRSEDCLVADLDSGQFPEGRWDVVMMLGVLEYMHDPEAVLTRIAAAAPRLILSYCCRADTSIAYRRKLDWVNDLTFDGLDALLRHRGWRVEDRWELKRMPAFIEVLMSCSRDGLHPTQ